MKRNRLYLSMLSVLLMVFIFQLEAQEKQHNCSFINNSILWDVVYDDDCQYLVRGEKIETVKHDINKLIKAWNDFSSVNIEYIKNDLETVFIKISDSTAFTESLGTTGARIVIVRLVFTLTECPQCKYIYIDFEEGSHATPGIYSRKDFMNEFKICE